jgi:hypothetical protein
LLLAADIPADEPATPAGSDYRNEALGLTLKGPAGWKMTAEKETVSAWKRLVTFYDAGTEADAVLTVRERKHATVQDLEAGIRREWATDRSFTVNSVQTVPATPGRSHPSVVLEATQVVVPPRPTSPSGAPAPAPPPVTYFIQATYWLGPGHEFLLYAKSRNTLWTRVRPLVEQVRASFALAAAPETGPAGEGGFADETLGFTCRYPSGYSVRLPKSKSFRVEFKGVGADAPVLSVHHFTGDFPVENDAQGLVKYYAEDQAGEASAEPHEVGGRPGMLVTARAVVEGKPTTVFIGVAKRGDQEFFRVRASMPREAEARGRSVFLAFLNSFGIGAPPR